MPPPRTLLIALVLLLTAPAFADEAVHSLSDIVAQQRRIRAQIDAGELDGLSQRQLNIIRKAQDEAFALSEGKPDLAELSIDQKVRLENALERIEAELRGTRAGREEQEVCWRERKTGSTMRGTRCGTQAERDQARQGARDALEKQKICTPPGCGG